MTSPSWRPARPRGLIVHGTKDNVVPEPDVQKLVDRLTAQKGIKITYNKIDGANHFFDKHEADVVETVKEYVSNMMSKPREGAIALLAAHLASCR